MQGCTVFCIRFGMGRLTYIHQSKHSTPSRVTTCRLFVQRQGTICINADLLYTRPTETNHNEIWNQNTTTILNAKVNWVDASGTVSVRSSRGGYPKLIIMFKGSLMSRDRWRVSLKESCVGIYTQAMTGAERAGDDPIAIKMSLDCTV